MRLSSLLCLLLLLPLTALAGAPQLLFDQSHRQAFLAESSGPLQLSELAATFQLHGIKVAVSEDRLSSEMLANFDALVISGAFAPHDEKEIEAILQFLDRGGKLAVMVHIGKPLLPLLHKLGVDVGNQVINEKQDQPNGNTIDISVNTFKSHPLTAGLEQFVIYGGWPLRVFAQQGRPIASSGPHSWVDMNSDQRYSKGDLMSPFDVIISGDYGRGSYVVFADDAIFQNKFLQGGNMALAENLSRWLAERQGNQLEI